MNLTEKRMLELLRDLRDNCGVIAIKAEFEAEGSRMDELVKLNEIVFRADMDIIIKIGGCEAVRDLDQCRLLGASGIMAPMIETPFAMRKFVGAAKKVYGNEISDIEWIINTETKTCLQNFDDILNAADGFLNTIAIGRVDLSSSMGLSREQINGDEVLKASRVFAEKAKARGLVVGFGGGISLDAIPFMMSMYDTIDKFETRKVVFSKGSIEKNIRKGLTKAMEFETLYLKNKCDFYDRMAFEDRDRLTMLEGRLSDAQKDEM